MAAVRVVEPEWLDTLPPEDPRARRSRRDLARLNAIMRNAGIVAGELEKTSLTRIAEIGAGDGAFAVRLAARLPETDASFVLVDQVPAPTPAQRGGWRFETATREAIQWLDDASTGRFDAIVANLFLHHLDDAPLERLLEAIGRRTARFVACEPRRSALSLAGSHLVGLVGCNDVTRHDAVASVRAGFSGREISALWKAPGWRLEERPRGLFSHLFTAVRE
ncbi:MAG TPA: methyltransferase [Usitatibacter sp.]|jgi:SAM-dependent methyltransferase|nr:methyltransferase [Usitatibacter sp.]